MENASSCQPNIEFICTAVKSKSTTGNQFSNSQVSDITGFTARLRRETTPNAIFKPRSLRLPTYL